MAKSVFATTVASIIALLLASAADAGQRIEFRQVQGDHTSTLAAFINCEGGAPYYANTGFANYGVVTFKAVKGHGCGGKTESDENQIIYTPEKGFRGEDVVTIPPAVEFRVTVR